MTKNTEMRELTIDELEVVSGGERGVSGWVAEIVDTAIFVATNYPNGQPLPCGCSK